MHLQNSRTLNLDARLGFIEERRDSAEIWLAITPEQR